MAILGPSELPYILKVDSDPMKKYVLSKLGYPSVEVEVTEDQWETVLRTTGNFIAHYFSKEQKLGVFYTTPLVASYDLPEDAYWVQEVNWDPVTTMIDQIFSAESFLFCFADDMQVLREDNILIKIKDWKDDFRAKTPFGPRKLILERHDHPQELVEVTYNGGSIRCTPNHPIKTGSIGDMIDGWVEARSATGVAITTDGGVDIVSVRPVESGHTTTIYAVGAHCFYGCHNGKPILVH